MPSSPITSHNRRRARSALVGALVVVVGACSGGTVTDAGQAPASSQGRSAPVVGGRRLPEARVGLSPVPNRNERNQPIELDETASLACAKAQFGLVALLQGDRPGADLELAVAIERGEASAVGDVAAAASALRAAAAGGDPRTPVETFLALCQRRGYIM